MAPEHDPNKIISLDAERAKRAAPADRDAFLRNGEKATIHTETARETAADIVRTFTDEKLEEAYTRYHALTDASNFVPPPPWRESLKNQRASSAGHDLNSLLLVMQRYRNSENELPTWVYAAAEALLARLSPTEEQS